MNLLDGLMQRWWRPSDGPRGNRWMRRHGERHDARDDNTARSTRPKSGHRLRRWLEQRSRANRRVQRHLRQEARDRV